MVIPAGPKLFFPNFIFTMVRTGKERNTNELVFRVPMILNKFDIKQYFEGLYNVKVEDVHTANFLSKTTRMGKNYKPARKSAIVKFKESFTFPIMTDPEQLKYPLPNPNTYKRIH